MLKIRTTEKLEILKFSGIPRDLEEWNSSAKYKTLSFDERLGLLVDRETIEWESHRQKQGLNRRS